MNSTDDVYVAKKTAQVQVDDRRVVIRKGTTRVAGDHPLRTQHPDMFEPVAANVRFGVEDALVRPGTRAGRRRPAETEPTEPVPYAEQSKKDLQAEIGRRNESREDDTRIVVPSRANLKTLAGLLEADDQANADGEGEPDSKDEGQGDDESSGAVADA